MVQRLFVAFFVFVSNSLFADAAPPIPPDRDQGFAPTLIMFGLAFVFFYFIMWRPEQKRRKEMEEARASLTKGDRVTAMGIIGTVSRLQEHTVVLRMVDGAKIEFLQSAITDIQGKSSGENDETGKKALAASND